MTNNIRKDNLCIKKIKKNPMINKYLKIKNKKKLKLCIRIMDIKLMQEILVCILTLFLWN